MNFSMKFKDPEEKAKFIMDFVDDLWRGTSSKATMTMSVQTTHWKRTLTMDAWSLDKDYSLVRITSPKKEAGTTTLKYENDIFNYLPKTDRTINRLDKIGIFLAVHIFKLIESTGRNNTSA